MDQTNKKDNCLTLFAVFLGLAMILLCLVSVLLITTYMRSNSTRQIPEKTSLPTPHVDITTFEEITAEKNAALFGEGLSMLEILNHTEIPINDSIEIAERLEGISDAPVLKSGVQEIFDIGDVRNFWKLDVDSNQYFQTEAQLEYITPHLYFWVEKDIDFSREDLINLAEDFERKIYPTDREIFGSEWSPGVDSDVHLTILFARDLGGVGGYFSSTDSSTREIEPYSNEMEMFYLSADYTYLDDEFTYGVLAHELQHMIHWNIDRNESAWITEGLSELAVELNGYDTGGFSYLFAMNPDLQLNFWPGNEQGDSSPHYGASYLFMRYLNQRYGKSSIMELVASPLNGFESIDEVIGKYDIRDNEPATSEQIFQDWSIANYLNGASEPRIDDDYGALLYFPGFLPNETLSCENQDWHERTVSQFGTDYIEIDCLGPFEIEITGLPTIEILPEDPHSGEHYLWSNYGDESNMSLERSFDLTKATTPIFFDFWTWYDIEKDYDYLYLSATTDGQNWKLLKPETCTENDPTGANYGCGLNGKSGGWIEERIDLSGYSGQKVNLRFEYITDMAVNGDGFLIDDVSIDAINYFSDFENDLGGWVAKGFVRIKNLLPQFFGIAILKNSTEFPNEKIISTGGLDYYSRIENNQSPFMPVVVISGLTRYTNKPANYRIRITKVE